MLSRALKTVIQKTGTLFGIATTIIAALCFKKTFPISNSLSKHMGRFVTKIMAAQGLFEANRELINFHFAYMSRKMELRADQGVNEKHKESFLTNLEVMNKIYFESLARKQYPYLDAIELSMVAPVLQENHYKSIYATHPSPAERRKVLLGN